MLTGGVIREIREALSAGPALVILVGAAGSGKSWLASQAAGPDQVLSLDALGVVIDATNVEAFAREPLLAIARRNHAPAIAVIMATPLEACLERNAARPGPASPPAGAARSRPGPSAPSTTCSSPRGRRSPP